MIEYEEIELDETRVDVFRPSDGEMHIRIEYPVHGSGSERIVTLIAMRRRQALRLGLRLLCNAMRRPLPWPPRGVL